MQVNSFLNTGALQGYTHTRVVNQYLGVVDFSECMIVAIELRFDRKLQEANVDRTEGDGKLRASLSRLKECPEQPHIR